MGTNSVHLTIPQEIEEDAREDAKKMGMRLSPFFCSLAIKFHNEAKRYINDYPNMDEIDVYRELRTELNKVRH